METEKYYKVLNRNRMPCHGGSGQWPYRTWTPAREPNLCTQGYHVCEIRDLINWLGPEIWEVEIKGKIIRGTDKLVAESARLIKRTKWNRRSSYLFAADCAEHVLHLFENVSPNDLRPRKAIEAARQVAYGKISLDTLSMIRDSAAHASTSFYDTVVYAAACAPIYSAACAASAAAFSGAAAASYASSAAFAAASSSSHAADSAFRHEREWQLQTLKEYLDGERG